MAPLILRRMILEVGSAMQDRAVVDELEVARLEHHLEVLKMPDVQQRFRALNVEPDGRTPTETNAFIKDEARRWGDVIRANNIMAE
jgi:tripartite-type tricarboxylate transporter receptor subunit TctC